MGPFSADLVKITTAGVGKGLHRNGRARNSVALALTPRQPSAISPSGYSPPFDTEQSYAVAAPSGANPQQIITKGAPEGETDLVNRFMAGGEGPPDTCHFFPPFSVLWIFQHKRPSSILIVHHSPLYTWGSGQLGTLSWTGGVISNHPFLPGILTTVCWFHYFQ